MNIKLTSLQPLSLQLAY